MKVATTLIDNLLRKLSFIFSLILCVHTSGFAQICVSEIMYHPQEEGAVYPNYFDNEEAEFIEITNLGSSTVDISSWCIDGVSFCFPDSTFINSNQVLLIAKNLTLFNSKYGLNADFLYSGSLSNKGEKIVLVDSNGLIQFEVNYDDKFPWPSIADGFGYSLELACTICDMQNSYNWRVSPNGHSAGVFTIQNFNQDLPSINNVNRNIAIPQANQAVQISATIEHSTSAQLKYYVNFGGEQTATILSNVGGNYIFEIPGLNDTSLVQYKIQATNAVALSVYPRDDSLVGFDGYAIQNNVVNSSNFPIVNWYYANDSSKDKSVIEHQGNFISNANVWWRRNKHWKVEMPKTTNFEIPGLSKFSVDEIQFNRPDHTFTPIVPGTMARTTVFMNLIAQEGEPERDVFNIRVDENGSQGILWTYFSWPDSDWREEVGIEKEGTEYWKFPSSRIPEVKFPKGGSDVNFQNLLSVKDSVGSHLLDIYDIPGMVNFSALSTLICHWDAGLKNFYMQLKPNGRWDADIWDVDAAPKTGVEETDSSWCQCGELPFQNSANANIGNLGNDFAKPLLANSQRVKKMYERRLRTLIDKYYAVGELINRATLYADLSDLDVIATSNHYNTIGHVDSARENVFVNFPNWQMARYQAKPNFPASSQNPTTIVINELQYAPSGGREEEFVELYNYGSESIDLSNWMISGLDLVLPFGTVILENDYLVVAKNSKRFIQKYGSGKYVAADFIDGQLENSGETIKLLKPDFTVIDSVRYELIGWKQAHGGPSLERISPSGASNDPANWAPSMAPYGTPDEINQADISANHPPISSSIQSALQINELMYNAPAFNDIEGEDLEFIEIKNTTNVNLNISGVYFSDGIEYSFPQGSSIAANGFVVLTSNESLFKLKYGFAPFGEYEAKLSSSGERIELSDSLDYIIDSVEYDDSSPWTSLADGTGFSLALYLDSTQNELASNWNIQCEETTAGRENRHQTEIQLSEYAIEICTNDSVNLSDLEMSPSLNGIWSLNNQTVNFANATGIYQYTFTNSSGCTSTDSLDLTHQIPDYVTTLAIAPSAIVGPKQVRTIVNITEIKNELSCTPVYVIMPKDISRYSFTYLPNALGIGGVSVNNSDWQYYSTNPSFHVWEYIAGEFPALGNKKIGFIGLYNPNNTDGETTFTVQLFGGSGGELNGLNNSDSESLIYFK